MDDILEKKAFLLIIPISVLIFNALIIFNPTPIILAARAGAILWFNNVLPSLLPFMIGTNILLKLGVVNFIGVMLEPIMRPLFGVSGKGALALAMGAASGYPIGAQVCASLREDGKISQVETQRLLSFVNNSGPLFMIGAIGAGMFGNARIGYFILVSNLAGAILSGVLFKFYRRSRVEDGRSEKKSRGLFKEIKYAERNKHMPFGKILSESILGAVQSLLLIAGFIIFFSVLLKILEITGVIDIATGLLYGLGVPGGRDLIGGAIYGFFEITNGASRLAELGASRGVIVLCAALVSFGGMSIFSQSIAFLSKTDIKPSIFFISKLLNAVFTATVGFLIYPLWNFEIIAPAFAPGPVNKLVFSTVICAMVIFAILITVFAANVSSALRNKKMGDY